MKFEIFGTTVPAVQCFLTKGEKVYTQSGGMTWMSGNIKYYSGIRNGLFNGIGRKFRGESFFLTTYEATKDNQVVAFGSTFPGTIKGIQLNSKKEFICQKSAFLCAENDVKSSVCFTKKIGAGIFGGEGMILQKLKGTGMAFLEIAGDVKEITLNSKEFLFVDSGCLVGFTSTVVFDVQMIKGFSNMFFAGEGLFLTKLTGPGIVYLQTQNIKEFLSNLEKRKG